MFLMLGKLYDNKQQRDIVIIIDLSINYYEKKKKKQICAIAWDTSMSMRAGKLTSLTIKSKTRFVYMYIYI